MSKYQYEIEQEKRVNEFRDKLNKDIDTILTEPTPEIHGSIGNTDKPIWIFYMVGFITGMATGSVTGLVVCMLR